MAEKKESFAKFTLEKIVELEKDVEKLKQKVGILEEQMKFCLKSLGIKTV